MGSAKPANDSKTKPELLIVDGHAMAFRAHYAFINQRLTNMQGMPTETIFGFFRMLIKLLQDRNPRYMMIVFDPIGPNFRSEMYSEYKANRKETPQELKIQLDELQSMVKTSGLPVLIMPGVEADDVIASIVEREKKSKIQITIVSGDKDLFALLHDNVQMLRPKKGVSEFVEINKQWLLDEMGLTIDQVPHYMALTGDSSDNVPGVKGIGEKTAQALMQKFNNIDELYRNIDSVTPAGVKSKLESGETMARLSLKLVTLKNDLKIEDPLEKFSVDAIQSNKAAAMFQEKGFAQLAKEWQNLIFKTSKPDSSSVSLEDDQKVSTKNEMLKNMIILKSLAEWPALEKRIRKAKRFSFDTETTGLNVMQDSLVGISLAFFENDQVISVYLPSLFVQEHNNPEYSDLPKGEQFVQLIKPLLEDSKLTKIGQNLKFDRQVMLKVNVNLTAPFEDTLIASYVLNPNQRRHNLDQLAEQILGHNTIKFEDLTGKGKNKKLIYELPLEELATYACEDAEVTLLLEKELIAQLKKDNLYSLYKEIDLPLANVLLEMEQTGILLDIKTLQDLQKLYEERLNLEQKKIFELAGEEFNIASTKELQRILFEKLGIESFRKTDKGALSTAANVLESLRYTHPIMNHILAWRGLGKLLNTYIQTLPDFVLKADGRIHTSFSQTTAATGRLASTDPNLQNIPVKDEDGRAIRKAFVASKDANLVSFDYSQIELRILAHYSEDKNLIEAYKNNADIHERASYMLFADRFDAENNSWLEKSSANRITTTIDQNLLSQMRKTKEFSEFRKQAKVLNFSIVYGVTDFGLSENLGVSRKEAKTLIELYFDAFPGIQSYMKWAKDFAKENGYIENLFGRRRRISDIDSSNRFAREGAERLAINTPIQSTAADMLKKSMIEISDQLKSTNLKSRMLLQIHDELLFEVPENETEKLKEIVVPLMENTIKLKVPVKVSFGIGKNWDSAK